MSKQATILIVEDEETLRSVLKDTLENNQFKVIEAKNGKEGVGLALSKHPDLILLDLLMPVMGGMDALKKIREDAWGKMVPVIILTNLSATDERLVEEMVAGRPSYYLIKTDWKMKDIVKKINNILAKP